MAAFPPAAAAAAAVAAPGDGVVAEQRVLRVVSAASAPVASVGEALEALREVLAAVPDADVVVFAEGWFAPVVNSGGSFGGDVRAAIAASPEWTPLLEAVKSRCGPSAADSAAAGARRRPLYVLLGSGIERLGAKTHVLTVLLGPRGIETWYRKRFPDTGGGSSCVPGREDGGLVDVFPVGRLQRQASIGSSGSENSRADEDAAAGLLAPFRCRLGLAICFDMEHPEVSDRLLQAGATLVLNPVHIPARPCPDPSVGVSNWRAATDTVARRWERAMREHGCTFVRCDLSQRCSGMGSSLIIGPSQTQHARTFEDCLVVADVTVELPNAAAPDTHLAADTARAAASTGPLATHDADLDAASAAALAERQAAVARCVDTLPAPPPERERTEWADNSGARVCSRTMLCPADVRLRLVEELYRSSGGAETATRTAARACTLLLGSDDEATEESIQSLAAADMMRLLTGTSTGRLLCHNMHSGEHLWQVSLSAPVVSLLMAGPSQPQTAFAVLADGGLVRLAPGVEGGRPEVLISGSDTASAVTCACLIPGASRPAGSEAEAATAGTTVIAGHADGQCVTTTVLAEQDSASWSVLAGPDAEGSVVEDAVVGVYPYCFKREVGVLYASGGQRVVAGPSADPKSASLLKDGTVGAASAALSATYPLSPSLREEGTAAAACPVAVALSREEITGENPRIQTAFPIGDTASSAPSSPPQASPEGAHGVVASVRCLAVAPSAVVPGDASIVLAGCDDGTVRLTAWRGNSPAATDSPAGALSDYPLIVQPAVPVTAIATDGFRIFTASQDRCVRVHTFEENRSPVRISAFFSRMHAC